MNMADDANRGLPIPYITAAWLGMSRDDILAGLKAGTILPPPGATRGWMPDFDGTDTASSGGAPTDETRLADRARVQQWFETIDPELDSSTFDSIWTQAGDDDAARVL